jgi:hypothetical protein
MNGTNDIQYTTVGGRNNYFYGAGNWTLANLNLFKNGMKINFYLKLCFKINRATLESG